MSDPFTPIHDEVLDALMKINLSPYETRVMFAIWRKTYGFIDKKTGKRKKYDWIAGSQLAEMTGLDRRLVYRALQGLKKKHVISRDDKKTGFSKEFMRLLSSVETTEEEMSSELPVTKMMTGSDKNDDTSGKNDDKVSSILSHTKERKEIYTKETTTKERHASLSSLDDFVLQEIADKYQVPLSFVISKLDDMTNWLHAKGRSYKDYKAALSNWVKKDMLQIRQEQHDKSKIAFIDPG